MHDSLERGGWFRYVEDPNEIDEMVDEIIDEIVAACARFEPGTVLGRDRSFAFARATAAA